MENEKVIVIMEALADSIKAQSDEISLMKWQITDLRHAIESIEKEKNNEKEAQH